MIYFWACVGAVCVILGIGCTAGGVVSGWLTGSMDKDEERCALAGALFLGIGIALLAAMVPKINRYEETRREVQAICESKGGVFANDKCFIEGEVQVEEGQD